MKSTIKLRCKECGQYASSDQLTWMGRHRGKCFERRQERLWRAMREKKGPDYDRWLAGMQKAGERG